MDARLQKYRPILGMLPLAGSIIASGSIAQLPPTNLNDGLRMALGGASLVGIAKTWCDADEADQKRAYRQPQVDADDAVRASVIESEARCNAAYYKRFPHHFRANKPVPREWLDLWAATAGQPHLAQHNQILALAPTQTQPIAPIAHPQPQTIQTPGQTRGGSFDRAGATDSPGTGWGDFEPRPPQPIAQTPPTFSAPIASRPATPYTPVLFDWRLIQQRPDKFPHVCVVGASGDGKTATQEWIARSIAGGNHLQVLSTKRKSDQWIGLEVVGLGRNFPPVSTAWHDLENELDRRCLDLDHAQTLPQRIIAIDELNDLVANSDVDLANIARAGREPRLRLVVNSHSVGVDGLGLRGKQDLKACFCWVRLGSFALQHAQTLANKGLIDGRDLAWLQGQQWPCMVDDSMAQLPDLSPGWQYRLAGATQETPPEPHETAAPVAMQGFKPDSLPPVRSACDTTAPPAPPLKALSPTPAPPTEREAELLAKFGQCKAMGMNKAQTVFALFGVTKGGNAAYKTASEFYERLAIKYQEISGDNAA